jgi:hypothetical protein
LLVNSLPLSLTIILGLPLSWMIPSSSRATRSPAGVLWFDWSNSANSIIWFGAAGCILAVLAITMGYFVPSNAAFAAKTIPVDQVSGKLDSWLMIHNLRIVLAFAASALGVWAVSC